jgi:hypothetical protein
MPSLPRSLANPDGALHLTAVAPILDTGGVLILTTEPWKPVSG